MQGLGLPTVTLGKTYLFAITSHHRLVIGDMVDSALAQHFTPGSARIADFGYLDQIGGFFGDRSAVMRANGMGVMERVKIVAITPQSSAPFALTVVDSLVPQVMAFSGQ